MSSSTMPGCGTGTCCSRTGRQQLSSVGGGRARRLWRPLPHRPARRRAARPAALPDPPRRHPLARLAHHPAVAMEIQMTISAPLRHRLPRAARGPCSSAARSAAFCLGAGRGGRARPSTAIRRRSPASSPTTAPRPASRRSGSTPIPRSSTGPRCRRQPDRLPARGQHATFTNGINVADFVVLNRIIADPADPLRRHRAQPDPERRRSARRAPAAR